MYDPREAQPGRAAFHAYSARKAERIQDANIAFQVEMDVDALFQRITRPADPRDAPFMSTLELPLPACCLNQTADK